MLGNNQALTGLVETGDLQPLQNLNQLTYLNLNYCKNLIGQSVSGFVREQPSPHVIGGTRRSSTAPEPESIDGVEPLELREAHWSVSFRNLYGNNQRRF